jgi:DNA-binding SARP family transcriptional activator
LDLTIHLLGQFQVLLNGKAITHFATDKVRALLAYLAIENKYPHRREKLAALFWPEKSESTARTNLRRALADLRANIQDPDTDHPFLLITRKDIQLNLDHSLEIDCLVLDQLANNGCKTQQDLENCDQLLDLYQGDFLEGFSIPDCVSFDEWLVTVREQYNRRMIHLLEQVIHYHQEQYLYKQALPYCWRLVRLSPWQEEPRRQLMQFLAIIGNREEALQQYENLKEILAEELGVEPEPETTQLMERIRTGEFIRSQPVVESVTIQSVHGYLFTDFKQYGNQMKEFVGRRNSLALLQEKLIGILTGKTGNVHFISGEAGSGKSWLTREFVIQAQDIHPPLVIASGNCNAYTGKGDPFLPFREIFSELCGDFEPQYHAGKITRENALRLWHALPNIFQSINNYGRGLIGSIIPEYLLVEEIIEERFAGQEWYQKLSEYTKSQHNTSAATNQVPVLFSQVTAVLRKIASYHPLILVIDDLHWADTGSINLLMHLGKHLAGSPILILCAFRSAEVFVPQGDQVHPLIPVLNELQREHGDILINLDEVSGREFITDVLESEPNALSPDFGDYLYRITAGHALAVSELLRSFQENGSLVKNKEGRWVECGQRAFEQLPPKIEGILALRIQTLPEQAQQYLSLASIQGEVFNAEVIAQVTGDKVKKVLQLLNHTVAHQHHLIHHQQQPLREKERFTIYKFHHILYQKYFYDNLDANERAQLHGQVGDALEALTQADPEPYAGQLAHHFHEAGRFEQAIPYYTQAGDRAKRMAGYQEATTLLETALVLNQQLPPSTERDRQELTLQMGISLAYMMILGTGHAQVKKANDRAWELCQTLEADEQRLDVLEILTQYPAARADYERCYEILALIDQTRSEMKEIPPREKIRQAWKDCYADLIFGRFKSCIQHSRKALSVYDETQDHGNEVLLIDIGIACHQLGAIAGSLLGDFQSVIDDLQEIARIMKTIEDKNFFIAGIMAVAGINLWLQEYRKYEPLLNHLLRMSSEDYFPTQEISGRFLKAEILSHQQKYDKAIEEFTKIIQIAVARGEVTAMSNNYLELTDVYLKKGDLANAKLAFAKAVENLTTTGETLNLSRSTRTEGNILLAEGDQTTAEEKYLEAIQIAQEQSAKTLELFAIEDLCRLWHLQGKTEQAHQHLSKMLQQFDGQPEVGILREAKALLETFQVESIVE